MHLSKSRTRLVLGAVVTGVVGAAGFASAATVVNLTATASPGSNPDATNGTTSVDAWAETTQAGTSGGAGSYYFAGSGWNANSWVIYSYPDATGPRIDETHAFDTPVAVGQTVSMTFGNSALTTGQSVGFSLTGTPLAFSFTGGDTSGHYRYADASTAGGDTGLGFAYQNQFAVSFTLTSATTYTATAGAMNFSGTYTGAVTAIDVFNDRAGNSSDVAFNALSVTGTPTGTPEPATVGLLGLVGTALLHRRR